MGLKGKKMVVEVEPETDEVTSHMVEGALDATETIGLKITTGSDGKYYVGVTHTMAIPEGADRDALAKAQIAFVITHRRLAEQALQNS